MKRICQHIKNPEACKRFACLFYPVVGGNCGTDGRLGVMPCQGLLLSGPTASGKTQLALAAATWAALPTFIVEGPQLISKYVGHTEAVLERLFSLARRSIKWCLL